MPASTRRKSTAPATATATTVESAKSAPPHDSARGHVTGRARYVGDHAPLAGQLYACVGGSEIAHGRVKSMDLSAVRAAAGVVDVITAAEVPGGLDIGPVFPGDPLFVAADGVIEYHGQPLFAVAATDFVAARRAAGLARIEYEPQPPQLDLAEAAAKEHFVRPPHRMQSGDAEAALAAAAHRIRGTIKSGGQEHLYIEGQIARALPGEDGGVTVHSSNQNPTETQLQIATVLGVAMHKVTVVTRRMGGAFGGKETHAGPWACIAALLAVRSGRAVECRLARRDDLKFTGKRHPFWSRYEVGFDDAGVIAAAKYTLAANCGNSPDLSDAVVDRAMFHCDNAYHLAAARIDGLRCKTHTVSNTAFRGFGGPQGMLVAEEVIDQIAFAVGADPLDIRKRNLYGPAPRDRTHYGQTVADFPLPGIIDSLERDCDYRARRAQIRRSNAGDSPLKRGLALTPVKFGISFTVAHLNQAGALLHLYTDGSLHLSHGGTEMGQGLMVKVAQVVAAELGVALARVRVSAARTDKVPNTAPTAASAGSDLNGMAAQAAAGKIKARLAAHLAAEHGVDAAEVAFADDRISVAGRTVAWAAAAQSAWRARVQLSATGFYRTPKIHYDRAAARGRPFYYYACGAAASEVVIDTLTGEFKLLRADILHDAGRSLNPAVDLGQVEGGFMQGVGWLTCEELKWGDDGRLLTDSAATYKIPAVTDAPVEFNARLLADSANAEATVLRSKAVGEPPLMLALSVWCAIRDALASLADYRVCPRLNAPATPEEILRVAEELRR